MFPLKHVTPVKLTAENNLGLQTSGWMADANLLLLLLRGVRAWPDDLLKANFDMTYGPFILLLL